jgi:hypothetical protein
MASGALFSTGTFVDAIITAPCASKDADDTLDPDMQADGEGRDRPRIVPACLRLGEVTILGQPRHLTV